MNLRRAVLVVLVALASTGCAREKRASTAELAHDRFVTAPSSIASLATARSGSALSSEIRFGGPFGRTALYLKFPSEWRTRGVPQRAFLALSAREGSASSDAPVTLEAWRISADWQPNTLQRWSDKPGLAPPYVRKKITASPAQDLRIDVTELLRFAAQNPERDFGIAIIASGSAGPGAAFSTGLAGGPTPRLELYLPSTGAVTGDPPRRR